MVIHDRVLTFLVFLLVGICFSAGQPFDEALENEETEAEHPSFVMKTSKAYQTDQSRDELDKDFWINGALKTVENKINRKEIRNVAKNIILFLGDGMSVPNLAAARILKGQREGKSGEESSLDFEQFPYVGLSRTYCVDSQVADSACSATAYLNGVKGNIATCGVTASVKHNDCEAQNVEAHRTSSIAEWAQKAGKATGLVTTTRVSHASPSGVYAHIANRDWEYDNPIISDKQDPEKCIDITRQLIQTSPGKNLKVIMGGGRGTFLPNNVSDPEYGENNVTGWRVDNRNLIEEWLKDKQNRNVSASYFWNKADLYKAAVTKPDYLLGLFEPSHMNYHLHANEVTEPTLEEMTEVAIQTLQKEEKGFFLFVEGGKIDMAHHINKAQIALDETIEFDKAIKKAQSLTKEEDTLIVVTADHAHTMSFSGYPERGSDILTKLQTSDMDSLPYSTISYANGPGYKQSITIPSLRYDVDKDKRSDKDYKFPTTLPLKSETHGGDDVAVFARGPWAHLLTGNYEQNIIPLVMGYAARIGPSGSIPFPANSASLIFNSSSVIALGLLATIITNKWFLFVSIV